MTKESKPYLSGEYEDIFTASSTGNLSSEEAVAYSQSYFKELDNQSAVRFAEKRGKEKGRQEGKLEGRQEALSETARRARELGLPEDIVSKLCDI